VNDDRFAGVSLQLKRAVQLYSDRKNPDYRNSIKESISAVESMAKIITSNDKATLVDALRTLERGGKLHTALKDGFIKLYAYTSDEDGIRHAMMQESESIGGRCPVFSSLLHLVRKLPEITDERFSRFVITDCPRSLAASDQQAPTLNSRSSRFLVGPLCSGCGQC
jgi:hypothetical protein